LARTLREETGFACVDLHPPNDVDALAAVARQGAHFRIYYDIPTYTDAGRKKPPCLLHSKLLLFRSTDGTAELWVGSHNWTNRASLGLNLEASIVIRLRDTARLFRAANGYPAEMKQICRGRAASPDFFRRGLLVVGTVV
jgi:phosphatidylserine/phosphatidylglycerophosphate/cardiolipin synthase-like enzyme